MSNLPTVVGVLFSMRPSEVVSAHEARRGADRNG